MFLVNWQSGQTPDCHLEGLIIQRLRIVSNDKQLDRSNQR
jgi:hypothetical protein